MFSYSLAFSPMIFPLSLYFSHIASLNLAYCLRTFAPAIPMFQILFIQTAIWLMPLFPSDLHLKVSVKSFIDTLSKISFSCVYILSLPCFLFFSVFSTWYYLLLSNITYILYYLLKNLTLPREFKFHRSRTFYLLVFALLTAVSSVPRNVPGPQ